MKNFLSATYSFSSFVETFSLRSLTGTSVFLTGIFLGFNSGSGFGSISTLFMGVTGIFIIFAGISFFSAFLGFRAFTGFNLAATAFFFFGSADSTACLGSSIISGRSFFFLETFLAAFSLIGFSLASFSTGVTCFKGSVSTSTLALTGFLRLRITVDLTRVTSTS